jgi:Protein involved in initiation of plasmid replication
MNKLAKKNKKNLVTQSNEISEAAYYLSLKAKRVLWMCFSQIKDTITDDHIDISNGQFDVHVSDYQNLFSVSVQTASADVKKGLDEILKSTVKFYPKEGEFEEKERPWLIEKSIRVGRGSYRVDFNPRLLPYIVGLTQQFTKFYLHECGTIKNSRTIRLYENLCQWRSTGIWTVTPQWLAERYQLPDSQRENTAEMKRSFIEPAINRINKETPLKVACSTTLHGTKVEKFVFTIVDES